MSQGQIAWDRRMIEAVCHCGAVRISVADAPSQVTDCNCSICRRLGALWAYYPASDLTIRAAPEATRAYVQGDRMIAFHHCRTCGCTTHWTSLTGNERMAINARLLEPADLAGAKVRKPDGAVSWAYREDAGGAQG